MKSSKWFVHPILIFILSILALGASLFLYIYWYIEASVGLRAAVEKFNLDRGQVLGVETWMVIMVCKNSFNEVTGVLSSWVKLLMKLFCRR